MTDAANRISPPTSPPDCPWVEMAPGKIIPEDAVKGGGNLNGDPVYIGRIYDEECYLVGTAIPNKDCCLYLSKNGEVKSTTSYDILTELCSEVLQFEPMALENSLKFVAGGDMNSCLYVARVKDGANTYIGWVDQDIKTVYIPRDTALGPNKVKENYDVLIHTLLDRLCICPTAPTPPF